MRNLIFYSFFLVILITNNFIKGEKLDFFQNINIQFYLLAYLVGSIPFGLILSKILKRESSNIAFLLNALKGVFVLLLGYYMGIPEETMWGIAVLVVIGHSFSIFLLGNGGKGISAGLGVLLFLLPLPTLIGIAIFVFFNKGLKLSLYSKLFGLIALIVASFILNPEISHAPLFIIGFIILYKHSDNINNPISKKIMQKFKKVDDSWAHVFGFYLFFVFFVAQSFAIPSGSMKRSMLIGDHLFVKKFVYGIPIPHVPFLEVPLLPNFNGNGHLIEGERPKRGDIVVFRYPNDHKIHFVKRCVAVGKDSIMLKEKVLYLKPHEGDEYVKKNYKKENIVNIDGQLWVKNPYKDLLPGIQSDEKITNNGLQPEQLFNHPMVTVEDDYFFMMGDNRDHSNDSRFWGAVPYDLIVGTPWFVYFSWTKDYKIRWDRVGKSIDTLVKNSEYINPKELLSE